jgi:hypothetical protein
MTKLLELIRAQRARSSGPDDFMVVHIQSACGEPNIRRRSLALHVTNRIEQAPGEPFDVFEARALAAAKGAGNAFISITPPTVDQLATAASEKIDAHFWQKTPEAMTNAELIATMAAWVRSPDGPAPAGLCRITEDDIAAVTPKTAAG